MENYKKFVSVNILLELFLLINLIKFMDNFYFYYVSIFWFCNIILINFGVVLDSLCKFGICFFKNKLINKCD